jgi:hypothetical protein
VVINRLPNEIFSYRYREIKMVASFLPTSRTLQPFDSFPPNLTWLLEIAFWRTEASNSCQGLSINYVSNFILGCLWFKVRFFDEIVYCEYIYCAKFQNKQRRSTNYPYWTLEKVGLNNIKFEFFFQVWCPKE